MSRSYKKNGRRKTGKCPESGEIKEARKSEIAMK